MPNSRFILFFQHPAPTELYTLSLTRRSSDLLTGREQELELINVIRVAKPKVIFAPYPEERHPDHARCGQLVTDAAFYSGDRKSTRLNSSHVSISYAVFCLKKITS